jgi:hypothetical protein
MTGTNHLVSVKASGCHLQHNSGIWGIQVQDEKRSKLLAIARFTYKTNISSALFLAT